MSCIPVLCYEAGMHDEMKTPERQLALSGPHLPPRTSGLCFIPSPWTLPQTSLCPTHSSRLAQIFLMEAGSAVLFHVATCPAFSKRLLSKHSFTHRVDRVSPVPVVDCKLHEGRDVRCHSATPGFWNSAVGSPQAD